MADRLRVFISSRMRELAAERAAVERALEDMGVDAFVFEADAGARPGSAVATYRDELVRSDVYLGIFWLGHGDYTADEYRSAVRLELPCLIYEKPAGAGEVRDPALQDFLDDVADVDTGHVTTAWFRDTEQLVGWVRRDVDRLRTEALRRQIHAGAYRYRGGALGGRLDPAAEPVVKLRRPPAAACPAPPDPFVDRERPLARVRNAIAGGERLVGFRGEPGMGKSALLAVMAAESAPGEAVCVAAADHASRRDVLAEIWGRFHETPVSYVPDDARLGADLAARRALVALDDVGLEPDDVQRLTDDMPETVFVVSGVPAAGLDPLSYVKAVTLAGLDDPDHILELFAADYGEAVPEPLRDAVVAACRAAGGGPGHVKKLANEAWGSDQALDQWLRAAAAAGDPMAALVRERAGAEGLQALRVVAAGGPDVPIPAAVAHRLGVSAGDLAALEGAGLVLAASPRYTVAGTAWIALAAPGDDELRAAFAATVDWAPGAGPSELAEARAWVSRMLTWGAHEGRHADVLTLARAVEGPLAVAGWWGAWERALDAARLAAASLEDTAALAWAQHQLGSRAGAIGDPETARALLQRAFATRQALGDLDAAALTAHNLGRLPAPIPPADEEAQRQDAPQPEPPAPRPRPLTRLARWLGSHWLGLLVTVAGLVAGVAIAVVALRGDAGPPVTPPTQAQGAPEFSAASVEFGDASVGGPARAEAVTLTNSGGEDLAVALAVEPADGAFAVAGGDCEGATLAGGASCTVQVAFAPPGVGEHAARLVAGNAAVALIGRGVAGVLEVKPEIVTFEPGVVGRTATRDVRLANTGDGPLDLTLPSLAGEGPFSLDAGGCARAGLDDGESCTFTIGFTPPRPGEFATEVVILAGATDVSLAVSGSGLLGWEVAGVRSDDVLNVRSGPGVENPVVGTLAPDATGVVTTGPATASHQRAGWWGVELPDGTTGWSRSDFLRLPAPWTAPYEDAPCSMGGAAPSPEPAAPSQADQVFALDWLTADECRRLVVVLGDSGGPAPLNPAARVPAGVRASVDDTGTVLTVALPDAVEGVRGTATERSFADAEAYVVRRRDGGLDVRVHLGFFASEPRAFYLPDPARLVVDVVPDEAPIEPPAKSERIVVTGVAEATGPPFTVSGYGRPVGRTGRVELRTAAEVPVRATFTTDGRTVTDTSAAFTTTDSAETWGSFSVVVDDFGGGRYELLVADPDEGVLVPLEVAGSAVACANFATPVPPPPDAVPIAGDFDGDGADDLAYAWVAPNAPPGEALVVRIELSYGYVADSFGPVAAGDLLDAAAVAAADIGADGADEVFVREFATGTGRAGVYTFVDCEVIQVRLPAGGPAVFVVGGLATASGLECTEGRLDVIAGTTQDGVTYEVVVTPYSLDGTVLFQVGDRRQESRTAVPALAC